jgi:hypothetical protein
MMNQTQASLLQEAIDDAAGALGPLRAASAAMAGAFRRFELAQANDELSALAANLGSLLVLTETVSAALNGAGPAPQGIDAGAALTRFAGCVETLLAARTAEDWIQVADILDEDLPVMLDAWSTLLAAMRSVAQGCTS